MKQLIKNIYEQYYKLLLILSLLLVVASIGVLIVQYVNTGEVIQRGVSLKGGITLTIQAEKEIAMSELQTSLSNAFPKGDISVRLLTEGGKTKAFIIEAADVEADALINSLKGKEFSMKEGTYSVESMGSSLGAKFFNQVIWSLLVAFIFMSIVVFITFRSIVPSSFVILAAVSDIVSSAAVVSLLGVKISTAGIAAFLMLIGYSVDTDILLTTRVLRRSGGTVVSRIYNAMGTGILMSGTSLVASLIAYFFSHSDVIKQITLIISLGMLFDIVYTWIQNAGILRWYLERKGIR